MEPEREQQQLRDLMIQGAAAFDIPDVGTALALYRTAYRLAIDGKDQAAADECRQYLLALVLLDGITQKEPERQATPLRMAEMAAWCTHCQLRPLHQALVLRVAINTAAKIKNYGTVLRFAERLLALCPGQEMGQMASKAARVSRERNGTNAMRMQYEPERPVSLCPASLTPIYQDETATIVWCKYCSCEHHAQFAGQQCYLCQHAELLSMPMLSGRGITGKSRLLCSGSPRQAVPQPLQAQPQDDWTQHELEVYADLARHLGLTEQK